MQGRGGAGGAVARLSPLGSLRQRLAGSTTPTLGCFPFSYLASLDVKLAFLGSSCSKKS